MMYPKRQHGESMEDHAKDFSESRDRLAAALGKEPHEAVSDQFHGRLLLRKARLPKREKRVVQLVKASTGGWNYVFVGCNNAPSTPAGSAKPYEVSTLPTTPAVAEKPYLVLGSGGHWSGGTPRRFAAQLSRAL